MKAKSQSKTFTLEEDECAIILKKDETLDVVYPPNFHQYENVPDHIVAFFGAAFALRQPEWATKLHELAVEKIENPDKKEKKYNSEVN